MRSAPGLAELFGDLGQGEPRSVLDLGPASGDNLRLYSSLTRRVRFADLLSTRPPEESPVPALEALVHLPEHPYELVLAWNVLDHVVPAHRTAVVAAIVDLMAPGARLHLMLDMSEEPFVRPLRFSLVDRQRLHQVPVGPPRPALPRPVPADVERLLGPLRVVRAFVLRDGMREYVAVRP